ncbi:MAG: hypothetical protein ABGZ35_10025 [Planctomycetaceae bacterium]
MAVLTDGFRLLFLPAVPNWKLKQAIPPHTPRAAKHPMTAS